MKTVRPRAPLRCGTSDAPVPPRQEPIIQTASTVQPESRSASGGVSGYIAPGFEEVRAEFRRNLAERGRSPRSQGQNSRDIAPSP
jgi:hypothetical protein